MAHRTIKSDYSNLSDRLNRFPQGAPPSELVSYLPIKPFTAKKASRIWKKTRRLNLICLLLTAASWLLLGIFYGLGYCPLTDWHFSILRKLGYTDLPDSYLSFLFTRLTKLQIDHSLVDAVTLWGLIIALLISLYLNFRHRFKAAGRKKASV